MTIGLDLAKRGWAKCVCAGLLLSCALMGPAFAQGQTLADIRQELNVLFVEIQKLKRELSTTGSAAVTVNGDTLQRVDLIEGELRRLTSRTEALEFRISTIVKDGTNRVGDLEFRLCELEADCDIATLSETTTLGGEAALSSTTGGATTTPSTTTEFAIGEQGDFERALAKLDEGDHRAAAQLFAVFIETYPGGPLAGQAHFYRAKALTQLGQDRDAGLAYLASFSGAPSGPLAPDALIGLGTSLGRLGQTREACATLNEVANRFPSSPKVAEAQQERARLGCS